MLGLELVTPHPTPIWSSGTPTQASIRRRTVHKPAHPYRSSLGGIGDRGRPWCRGSSIAEEWPQRTMKFVGRVVASGRFKRGLHNGPATSALHKTTRQIG